MAIFALALANNRANNRANIKANNRRFVGEVNVSKAASYAISIAVIASLAACSPLPSEKMLIEADAYTPSAANASPPAEANPYSLNLYSNIKKLKLDVKQIAALNGPRITTLAGLRTAIDEKG